MEPLATHVSAAFLPLGKTLCAVSIRLGRTGSDGATSTLLNRMSARTHELEQVLRAIRSIPHDPAGHRPPDELLGRDR